jgi:uncharacterized protein YuzE
MRENVDLRDPHMTYYPGGDILYIEFREGNPAHTRTIGDWVIVDTAEDGSLHAVELINTSAGIDLSGLPEREKIEAAIRAIPHFKVLAT